MMARKYFHCVYATAAVLTAVITSGESSCVSTGVKCKRSCVGLPAGSYQSCRGCNVYWVCGNGQYEWMCAQGLKWNDDTKFCDWTSTTCECLQSLPKVKGLHVIDDSSDDDSDDEPVMKKPKKKISKTYKTYYGFSRNCLACICEVEGCMEHYKKCRINGQTLSCGPFQIKEPYWIDAHEPGRSFERCTRKMSCSRRCVRAYMDRYADACALRAGNDIATCEDYARVHNGGPNGCIQPFTLAYWKKVHKCCVQKGGC